MPWRAGAVPTHFTTWFADYLSSLFTVAAEWALSLGVNDRRPVPKRGECDTCAAANLVHPGFPRAGGLRLGHRDRRHHLERAHRCGVSRHRAGLARDRCGIRKADRAAAFDPQRRPQFLAPGPWCRRGAVPDRICRAQHVLDGPVWIEETG